MKPPNTHSRRFKPDPNDPSWTFPFASREYIQKLEKLFASFTPGKKSFFDKPHKSILPQRRPNPIPWESVPPQYRHRCQQLFNRKIAEERAKGIPGWPTQGKIKSLRMNCTNAGRHYFNGEAYARYCRYLRDRNTWMRYLEWLAEQRHAEQQQARGPEAHAQLEVG